MFVERGNSAVECWTRNRESPRSYPICYHINDWAFLLSPRLAIDGGGNVNEYSSRVIAAWLECFQEKSSWCRNEQVCQGVKCKHFEFERPMDWILRCIKRTFNHT